MNKKSHQKLHDIVSKDDIRCDICNRYISYVLPDAPGIGPYWRHKPEGYNWGDRARRAEERLSKALEIIRLHKEPGSKCFGFCRACQFLKEVAA